MPDPADIGSDATLAGTPARPDSAPLPAADELQGPRTDTLADTLSPAADDHQGPRTDTLADTLRPAAADELLDPRADTLADTLGPSADPRTDTLADTLSPAATDDHQGPRTDTLADTLSPAASHTDTLAAPPAASTTRARQSSVRLAAHDLPPGLDRSSLTPAERALAVSRYILLSRLGVGGMGLVFLAYDPALDRKVALKLLRPGDDREPAAEAHARLHREAQALAKLSHPNVVAVYDVGTYDARGLYGDAADESTDGVFLVMEYIEGVTLARWLDERRRAWRDVLAVFLAAGRGLAAAHAVGILHRDFKPSNVLVKPDGSVHVFDFGLARAAGGHLDAMTGPYEALDPHHATSVSLSAPLTQIGAVVGTPVYMAPEQRGGEDVDERSDQFSFCVALYEGLFGCRPFSGENFYALEVAKLSGTIDPPKRPVHVPGRLRRAVVRGLAGEPDQRWPTLPALLAELERIHRRRRRGRIAAAAAITLALGATAGAVALTREPVCTAAAAAQALGDAWNPRDAPTLERTFVATGLPYARDTWQRTRDRLDRHAAAWLAMHTATCEATNVARTQSAERMDLRMQCLDRLQGELAALVAVFAEADADVVANAVAAAAALTPVATCEDPDARAARDDPALAHEITRAGAELHAGRPNVARSLAEVDLAGAQQLGDRALQASAALVLGAALVDLSEFAAAERTLTTAYFDAVAAARDPLAVDVLLALVDLVGDRQARPDDGRAWARHTDALLDRLGRPPAQAARHENNLGNLAVRTGAYADARAAFSRALELHHGDPLTRAEFLGNLAHATNFAGRPRDAIDLNTEALALREAALGPGHPDVAQTLTGIGASHLLLGEADRAEDYQRRAITIWRASLGPRSDRLAHPLSALGDIALGRSQYPEARAAYEEARAIWEHNFGPEFPAVAGMNERLATVRFLQGDVAEAHVLADRALAMWARSSSPDPLQRALALIARSQVAQAESDLPAARRFADEARAQVASLGDDSLYSLAARLQLALIALDEQRPEPAVAELEAIVAVIERDYGLDARWLVEPLTSLGRAYHDAGRLVDARVALLRAAPIADAAAFVAARAEIDLVLARVAWRDGDPARARSLATAAADVYRRIGAGRSLAETEAWLRDHPAP